MRYFAVFFVGTYTTSHTRLTLHTDTIPDICAVADYLVGQPKFQNSSLYNHVTMRVFTSEPEYHEGRFEYLRDERVYFYNYGL